MITNFIIVDDDTFNNTMCRMLLKKALGEIFVTTFEVPEDALTYIQSAFGPHSAETILLLDINMPTLTAWQFMEKYEHLEDAIKARIHVYIVSSSVDNRDKDAAGACRSVRGFMSKPLDKSTIASIAQAISA